MPDEIKELYDHGKELFEKGDYVGAEGLLREVLKHNPRYADVLNKLGVITCLKGSLKEASEFFEEALRLNPLYTEAALNLTVTYNEMGLPDKAIEVVERASKSAAAIEPGSARPMDPFVAGKLANEHYKLGNLYIECNLPEGHEAALGAGRRAYQARRDPEAEGGL
jgi:tetratricopeptide (TPR) repeat protein